MAYSQNGYKANDSSLIASYTIARDVKINLRKGDVSSVLLHFAKWFDQHIEPLTAKDTGGYNPRTIAGSSVLSNHASGTAMDLRWNKHPQGKKGTFTKGQTDKIRAQLKLYEGVIRWGGDYSGRVDEMHFEINRPPADVTRVANKLKTPKPAPKPAPKPVQKVKPVTEPLKVDGVLGPKTIARWQQIMGTPVDGKISENSALVRAVQRKLKDLVDHRLVVDGDGNSLDTNKFRHTVAALQRYLKSPVDGVISTPKSQVIMALQRRLNTGKF